MSDRSPEPPECPIHETATYRGRSRPGLDGAVTKEWLASLERLSEEHAHRKPGRPAASWSQDSAIGRVFVKEELRAPLAAWRDRLIGRAAPAARAFEIGLHLERAEVSAARPLAVFERRRPGRTFIFYEHCDAADLREYLLAGRGEIDELMGDLGVLVARLHGERVRQRDLKAPNVLIETRAEGDVRARLVDLEGMRQLRRPPRTEERARDLARLLASLSVDDVVEAGVERHHREALLAAYLEGAGASGIDLPAFAWWSRWTDDWVRGKLERNRRHGRVLH